MKTTEDRYKFIGKKIKEAREALSMSQKALAEALGYESATAISLIESGERRVKIEDLEKIAEVLQRDLEYFLGKESKKIDIKVALRASKELTEKDKEAILHFIEIAKKRRNGNGNRN